MRHPVHELLAAAAYEGREVTSEELAELKLSTEDADRVRRATRQAALLHAGHEQARAHEHARLRAQEIVAQLPEEQRDPKYLHEGTAAAAPGFLASSEKFRITRSAPSPL